MKKNLIIVISILILSLVCISESLKKTMNIPNNPLAQAVRKISVLTSNIDSEQNNNRFIDVMLANKDKAR